MFIRALAHDNCSYASSTAPKAAPATANISQADSAQILANQRLHRPVAPHLGIYKPQITWVGSGLNRMTAVMLSGGMYLFSISYLAAPLFGLQLTSAAMAAGFAKWPFIAKVSVKLIAALPFTYHSLNGLRHLAWDTVHQLTNAQVNRTGWIVVGASVLSALVLAVI